MSAQHDERADIDERARRRYRLSAPLRLRVGQREAGESVVALGYLEKADPKAPSQPEHNAERQVDLATLARADVVAMQARPERKLLLRDPAINAQLTKNVPECDVLGRLRGSHPPKLSANTSIRLPHIYGDSVPSGNPCDF